MLTSPLIFALQAKNNLAKLETSFSRLAKTRRFRVFVAASLPRIAARRENRRAATRRRLLAAILVLPLLAFLGCGDSGHGGHADSGHGESHGSDAEHDSHSGHDAESSHDAHGATAEEAPSSHGPTDEELETGIAFIARPRQLVEVDLGEVFVSLHGSDEEPTYLFESQIFGLVDEGHLTEFNEALAKRREAMREALRATIAKSETKDLFDPKLAGLKITLASVARKTLGSPHLYDILFSDLSIEQD